MKTSQNAQAKDLVTRTAEGEQTAPADVASSDFTEKLIANWRAFERVRGSGRFNMYDPQARRATGLTNDEYVFVMQNYTALKARATGAQP